jgi:hypothetical protein
MVMVDHKVALEETVERPRWMLILSVPIYGIPSIPLLERCQGCGEVIQSTNHRIAIRSAIWSVGRT